ncbi:MAG: hypothetical protein SVM86_08255 [Candidatus Cloacimonadota bacterium]|nr:hypothetical protein [Candidatus Cloacimonadota bacterium]
MRKFLFLVILTLLLITGCNRFDSNFTAPDDPNEPEEISLQDFFVNLNDSLQILEPANLAPIMAFYPSNYLNNGKNSQDIINFYTDIINENLTNISAILIEHEYQKVKWRLTISNKYEKNVVDSTIVDIVNDSNTAFIGNQSVISFSEYIQNFSKILENSLVSDNTIPLMEYYADDYLNNDMDKSAMRVFYNSLAAVATSNLQVTVNYTQPFQNKFSYWIYDVNGVINSTKVDYAAAVPDSFLIVGTESAGEFDDVQKVLVELGTGIWCSNCPYAEAALHSLKEEFSDQFYYIEYHVNDALQVEGNLETLSYYGDTTLPIAKFQGQTKLSHNNEATLNYYRNVLTTYLNQEARAFLDNNETTITEEEISGLVQIELQAVSQTNLYLKYSLVELESDKTNFAGEKCKQVVLANGSQLLETTDLSQPIQYNLDLPDYLPEDIVLYLWLQTLDEPYDEESCKIYNVIEVNL